jgi:hypothetical protein
MSLREKNMISCMCSERRSFQNIWKEMKNDIVCILDLCNETKLDVMM